ARGARGRGARSPRAHGGLSVALEPDRGRRGLRGRDRRRARAGAGEGMAAGRARCRRLRRYVLRHARALQAALRGARVPMNERRMRITGLHHITLLVADGERSLAFYRNVLGLRLVKQTVNDDDSSARHLIFGDEDGRPGTLITCLEYPDLD